MQQRDLIRMHESAGSQCHVWYEECTVCHINNQCKVLVAQQYAVSLSARIDQQL